MVLLSAWQHPSLLRRPSAGGHHAAPRPWPFRVPRAPPAAPPAAPAAQPWVPAAAQQQRYAARAGVRAAASQQQPAGQPAPGMDPAVAAYLEQHGISATQLQQERPAAAAALTLPLAGLLVKAVAARQGGRNILAPTELAARLVFLASEAGVTINKLEQVYLNQLRYLCFKLESAREVLVWLHANLSGAALQHVAANNPSIWGSLRPTLEAAKADLQQLFGLTKDEWEAAVHSDSLLLNGFSGAAAVEVVGWLRWDVGMSEEDISRLFKREHSLFYQRASRLPGLLEYVLDRLHIDRGKAVSLVLASSTLFNFTQDSLEQKISDLELYGFSASQIGSMMTWNGLLVSSTFDGVISPSLDQLEQLLTGHLPDMTAQERRAVVIGVTVRGGTLIVSNPAKLHGNFDFLLSQGLSQDAAREVLHRNPQVFQRNMRSKGFADKLRYYESELGIPPPEMLLKYSTYLKEGLAKVDQRVFCMERRGKIGRLKPGEGGKLTWMQLSAASFRAWHGVSLKEWEECVAEWPASERAQQYGLVGQASRRGFNVDLNKVSRVNKARHSRKRGGK